MEWTNGLIDEGSLERLGAELAGAELQAVLLEVVRRRAEARRPKDLLDQYRSDQFCAPAAVDLRVSLAIDSHLLEAAKDFEAIELSPVAPLGACSVVALTHQDRVLSALRATEVVSDPTNVLALECAERLRLAPGKPVHLATSHRVVRAQPVPKVPGYSKHFRMFALASAGVERESHGLVVESLLLHVRTMRSALERLQEAGLFQREWRVKILSSPAKREVGARIVQLLGGTAEHGELEHPYYSGGIRYQISIVDGGDLIPIIDGGSFDWLGQLASNRRAVFVASGLGSQLLAARFRPAAAEG